MRWRCSQHLYPSVKITGNDLWNHEIYYFSFRFTEISVRSLFLSLLAFLAVINALMPINEIRYITSFGSNRFIQSHLSALQITQSANIESIK
nr:MAG TPA: hypothetical protein [Caudoviricetes sp.]